MEFKWTEEELTKWVMARRKRFPLQSNRNRDIQLKEEEMSKIEQKLRLKNLILGGNSEQDQRVKKIKKQILKQATIKRRVFKTRSNEEITEQQIPKQAPNESKTIEEKFTEENIVKHLKEQKEKDKLNLKEFLREKPQNFNYNYIQNSLHANLVLDEVYQERENILQMVDFLVKQNFFLN